MKNTTKTILEWLEQAKADGYEWADAAIENTINDPSPAGHCFEESLYEALCGAFIFDETPQGEEYWQSISISLLNSGKMKNTVSFPTAQRLKAVGFPQPEPESGQVWHHKDGSIFIIVFNGSEKVDYVPSHAPIVCREYKKDFLADQVFFAPTATDILEQLPSTANISKPFNAELWICIYGENEDDWTESDNPAEAAAIAWLEIHEKKAFTPNARIKFKREQTIECYDENGKQNLLVIGKGKEYDAILKDMKATIKTVFGPVEFHLSNNDLVFLEWL